MRSKVMKPWVQFFGVASTDPFKAYAPGKFSARFFGPSTFPYWSLDYDLSNHVSLRILHPGGVPFCCGFNTDRF